MVSAKLLMPITTAKSLGFRLFTQCAAVTTVIESTRAPPQKCLEIELELEMILKLAIHGHELATASSPFMILFNRFVFIEPGTLGTPHVKKIGRQAQHTTKKTSIFV